VYCRQVAVMTQQRKLVAIMFTDLVGYVALSQRNEALALELLKEHQELLRPLFSQHHGTEIKTIGDAFLVEFGSAVEAAGCAVDIQKALTAYTSVVTPERRIQVRIGLHVGDVVFDGDDVLGDGVNIASRIEPLAPPGGICVTEDVAHQIENKIGLPLELLGEKELKGIRKPVTVYRLVLPWEKQAGFLRLARVALRKPATARWARAGVIGLLIAAGVGWWWTRQRVPSIRPGVITRLAVLPFTNLMNDPEQDYFVDGMHDALLTELSKLGALSVISRQSVMRFKGSDKSLGEIARELQAHVLIEGSVLRAGDNVRINVQLIEAAADRHLWAEIFDRKLEDVLALHSNVARAIAGEIKVKLTPEEEARLASSRRVNPEAYEAYMKGMFYANQFTPEGFERGLAYLRQAIEIDPEHALPYANLALALNLFGHGAAPPPGVFPQAKAAALKALELDETLAEAHAALAEIKLVYEWDWPGAEQAFQRALELNPNIAAAHYGYGWYLLMMGRMDEAIAEIKQAKELDPLTPLLTTWLAYSYWVAGEDEEAINEAGKSLELDPDFAFAHFIVGCVYAEKGMYEEAIAAHQKAADVSRFWSWGLGISYALAGRKDEARKIATELEKGMPLPTAWVEIIDSFARGHAELEKGAPVLKGYIRNARGLAIVNSSGLAEIYTALGEKDKAFRWLEAGFEQRQSWMPWIWRNPNFTPLRDDPRFRDLLRRMNLPE